MDHDTTWQQAQYVATRTLSTRTCWGKGAHNHEDDGADRLPDEEDVLTAWLRAGTRRKRTALA